MDGTPFVIIVDIAKLRVKVRTMIVKMNRPISVFRHSFSRYVNDR
jgi:hypothetical protein